MTNFHLKYKGKVDVSKEDLYEDVMWRFMDLYNSIVAFPGEFITSVVDKYNLNIINESK